MSVDRSFFVIVNPAAGRGRAAKIAEDCASRLRRLGRFELATTTRPGQEVALADRAIAEGFSGILAVGGDGTWGKVVDRIVRSGRKDVTLGLLPAGTGNDFAKSLGIRAENIDQVIRGIAEGRRRTIDVGRAGSRYFLNVVGFGFDIAVIDDAARLPVLHGDLLYRFCALRQLFKYSGVPIEVSDDRGTRKRRDHLMLTVSNGNYFGGSFHIAPAARLDDGRLDAVSIYDAGPIGRAALFSRVSKGTHPGHEKVDIRQAPRFTIGFDAPVRYEIDGDVYDLDGTTLEIEAVARALDVFIPAG
jgi:diacylglycerol kinase (ATP)